MVDLSGVVGIPTASEWLRQFETDGQGVIVYKAIGDTMFAAPEHWSIGPNSVITEVVNHNRQDECGCGVNFSTFDRCSLAYPSADIWKCRINWIDLADVVVPYSAKANGKARCARLTLLEKVRENGS
jgi:hypothetical protein